MVEKGNKIRMYRTDQLWIYPESGTEKDKKQAVSYCVKGEVVPACRVKSDSSL